MWELKSPWMSYNIDMYVYIYISKYPQNQWGSYMFWVHHSWTFSYWMKNSLSPNSLSTSYAKNKKIPALSSIYLIDFPGFTWVSRPSQPQTPGARANSGWRRGWWWCRGSSSSSAWEYSNRSDESWCWMVDFVCCCWMMLYWSIFDCVLMLFVDRSWWFWGLVGYCDLGWGHFWWW